MLWFIFPGLDKSDLGVFRQHFSCRCTCVTLSVGSSQNQFSLQTNTLALEHVRHNQSSSLFIETIRRHADCNCCNSCQSVRTWRVRGASFMMQCVVKPHTVAAIVAVQVCFAQGLKCRDVLPLLNMGTGASVCQPKHRSGNNWVYIPTSNLYDPIFFVIISLPFPLQYLDPQPRPLFMFYSGLFFFLLFFF